MSWFARIISGKSAADGGQQNASVPGARLLIDRQEYGLAELGVRTFRVRPYEGALIGRQNFSFTLILTVDNEEFSCLGSGVVREISAQQGLIAKFLAPQPVFDRKLMEFLARRRTGQRRVG
jgi:hypothetical protein